MKRIGIVGVGGFAATVLHSILFIEREGLAHLAAAVIRNPAKYPDVVKQMQGEGRKVYPSLPEMLENEKGKFDIVSIPTGIPYHSEMAIQALEAGCDVVLEKPIAATVQEVDAIIAAEKRTGHFCAIGYQHIHTPAIQSLREEVENGRLGKIKRAKCYALWPRGRSYYERNSWAGQVKVEGRWVLDGPLTNALAHFLHNMFYLIDAESGWRAAIESLRAELYRGKDIPTYDTVCLRARMNQGAEVFIALSHAVGQLQNPIMEIEAENASAVWMMDGAKAVIRYRDGTVRTVETPSERDFHADAFRDAIAVAEGKRARPLTTPLNGRPHVLAVDLAFESSGGILNIPLSYRQAASSSRPDRDAQIRGMEDIIRRSFAEFKLFSELGAPWAQPGSEVRAAGYTEFPRSAQLREALSALTKRE